MHRSRWLTFVLALMACAVLTRPLPASVEPRWMSEEAMRAEFVGRELEGHFRDGRTWSGSYDKDGRFDGCEEKLCGAGRWLIRAGWFCLRGGSPSWDPAERCGAVIKMGANCYQFHWVFPGRSLADHGAKRPETLWHSRGWRKGEPATCTEQPTV